MSETSRPRVSGGLLAVPVVLGVVLIWWLFSGNGPQGPEGNDPRLLIPEGSATGAPLDPAVSGPLPVAVSNGLRIDGFTEESGGGALALNYTVPVDGCTGTLRAPRVVESEAAVTVTLTHEGDGGTCQEPGPHTARVQLTGPVGDRSVVDGALTRRVVVERMGAAYEPAR